MIVNELVTKFKFDMGQGFRKFDAKLKDAKRDTQRATGSMRGMFQRFGRGVKDALRQKLEIKGIRKAKGDLNSVSSMARSLKGALLGIGAGYLGFQGVNAVMSRTLKVGMENEELFSRLSTLRGPVQAIRDSRQLQETAAKTPYKVNELTDAFVRLNAAGFKVDIKQLSNLGDLAAGSNKPLSALVETMLSASRGQAAMIDNFNGMAGTSKNGNIEITSLDSKTGQLTKTMVKAGDKAALLDAYLKAATEQDTVGAMEKLSGTTKGLLSTLSDNIDMALLDFYKGIEDSLKDVIKEMTSGVKSARSLGRQFGVFLKMNLPRYIENIKTAFRILKPIIKVAAIAAGVFITHWVGLKALKVASMIGKISMALKGLTFQKVIAGIKGLKLASAGMTLGIGAAVLALAALAYDFNQFMETGDSALLRFTEKWPTLHDNIEGVYLMLESFVTGLEDIDATTQWWADNSGMYLATLKNEYGILFDAITTYIGSWIQYAVAKFDQFMLYGRAAWKAIKDGAQEAWIFISSSVMGVFNRITTWLAELPGRAATAFGGLVTNAKNKLANMPVIGGAMQFLMRNKGGFIPGSGNRDTVPTMLTPGEFVINKQMVQSILSGNPKGLMQLQSQMRAPQMASTGSTAITPQSVGSYSVPVGAMASGATNVTINAPITQTNNINGMGNSPSDVGAKLANSAMDRFNKGLSNAARQVPQRIARA